MLNSETRNPLYLFVIIAPNICGDLCDLSDGVGPELKAPAFAETTAGKAEFRGMNSEV
jgi:hypothetical protein